MDTKKAIVALVTVSIALLPLTLTVACGDAESTAVPDRGDAITFPSLTDRALSDKDAIRHNLRLLEYELADDRYLSLTAALNGQSVEERQAQIDRELTLFRKLDAQPMSASSSAKCKARELEDKDTYLRASTVWPGWGAWIYSTGFSVADGDNSSDGTIHRIHAYVEGGTGHYPGNPLYNANTGIDRTSGCVKVFSVISKEVFIPFMTCWWAYGESMHRVIGTDIEEYTSALYDRCGGDRVDNPFF